MHLKDIKKFIKCKKLYQLSQFDKTTPFQFYNINVNIDELIVEKLNIKAFAMGEMGDTNERTKELLSEYEWLFRVRFTYRDLRIKVPLLHKINGEYEIYFITLATSLNTDEVNTYYWYQYILEKCGLKVKEIYVLCLNANYIRRGKLEPDSLFIQRNTFKDERIIDFIKQSDIDIESIIDEVTNFELDQEIYPNRTIKCTRGKKCSYYDFCFPTESILPDNSIINLVSSQYKYKMYDNGIEFLKDADPSLLEGTLQQYAQIKADRNNGLFCDKNAVNHFLNNLKYPISYVDFEWDLFPIPPYDGMKSLDVLVFQYALDIDDGEKITHFQYIGEQDSRKGLIESLLKNLPKQGSIVAYNALGAEVIRLKELGNCYPEYQKEIEKIIKRFVDLSVPFMRGSVYDVRMKGLYSLKVIEDVIDPKHNYHDLDIENGLQAVEIHRLLENTIDKDVKEEYYNQLYEYCNLDASSMIKTVNWLRKIVK